MNEVQSLCEFLSYEPYYHGPVWRHLLAQPFAARSRAGVATFRCGCGCVCVCVWMCGCVHACVRACVTALPASYQAYRSGRMTLHDAVAMRRALPLDELVTARGSRLLPVFVPVRHVSSRVHGPAWRAAAAWEVRGDGVEVKSAWL